MKVAIAGVSGGLSNIVATGKPKSFLSGFAQAAALAAVGGTIFKNAPGADASSATKVGFYSKKAIVHGVIGGAVSEARGGKFSSGFVAAGVSAFAGIKSFDSDTLATAYHAVVGGVGSVLGGGKFADGAVSGAFGYLFNACASRECFVKNTPIELIPNNFIGPLQPHQLRLPPGANIDISIALGKTNAGNLLWFRQVVRNGGVFDYKQAGSQYEEFGNFHYGVLGRAVGISEDILLREAGRAQIEAGTSSPDWGSPGSRLQYPIGGGGTPPFGDDPRDQFWIKKGFEFYDNR